MTDVPQTAMVLAAGLGKRMRPITDTMPKPLVAIAGKTLLDWGLDSLAEAGVATAVVNVHYLPDQIVAHVADADDARRSSSPTSATGCSIRPAASSRRCPSSAHEPFFILNADTFWIDRGRAEPRRGSPLHGTRRGWIFC